MKLFAKIIETGEIYKEFELENNEWNVLCDTLVNILLLHMKNMNNIEHMFGNYKCKDNGLLLKKWIDYNDIYDMRTMQSFINIIHVNRGDFMKLLIHYEMIGLYHMLQYGYDEGCFSEGQIHDISETLLHLKHSYKQENNEHSIKYYNLLNGLQTFFENADNMRSIIIEYIWT